MMHLPRAVLAVAAAAVAAAVFLLVISIYAAGCLLAYLTCSLVGSKAAMRAVQRALHSGLDDLKVMFDNTWPFTVLWSKRR